jgi:transposase
MVGERKSQKVRDQVIELHRRGAGKRKIALMLGISKNTVKGILRALEPSIAQAAGSNAAASDWSEQVLWGQIQQEIAKPYVTIKCLHAEHAPEGVSYLKFWREFKRRMPEDLTARVRVRLQHPPGKRVEVDYCDGIPIVDPKTGTRRITHLFAAVSSFSDYTYGEFVFTQKRDSFIASQERMHHFFGGVFEYLVIDNLKSGVHEAHLYDPDLNAVYVDYANHMGFAVLPARPRTPRDKPAIETGIGVIQRQFYAEVRNRTFTSLEELNTCFREYLTRLNLEVMKDYGVSRASRFAEEKGLLKALPVHAFEVAEYRKAKVHPDCHVQLDRNFYSVPYALIGQTLRVRLTARLVEIFNEDHQSVAIHARLQGIGKFSTDERHYPEQKLAAARFDIRLAQREASRIGPETAKLVDELLGGNQPLRYLRRVQGILRLRHKYSIQSIEYGAHQALMFNRPRLAYVTDCAKRFELGGLRPRVLEAPERDLSSVYLQKPGPELPGHHPQGENER